MVKKIFFAFLFYALNSFDATAFANGQPLKSGTILNECNAPPPDSFRVTGLGYNFISVAWNPASLGDKHVLTVFQESSTNEWDSLYSIILVNASSHTVTNLNAKNAYRFQIRTVCSNGDPSTLHSDVMPPHGLILELTANARPPDNPKATSCAGIDYLDPANEWIGFRVSKYDEGIITKTSLFQFEKVYNGEVVGLINRVEGEDDLVAANVPQGQYPPPTVQSGLLFRMEEISTGGLVEVFGYVDVVLNIYPLESVDLCISPVYPWDNSYTFEPLIVNNAENPNCPDCPPGPGDDEGEERLAKKLVGNQIKVQSPFTEYLNIYYSEFEFEIFRMTLFDINGIVNFYEHIDIQERQLSIPTGDILPGFYILRIESSEGIQCIKVLKAQ